MSSGWETESDPAFDELLSVCLLSQCGGCTLCQNTEFLPASRLIEELEAKIKDAAREAEHLHCLHQQRCNHHIVVDCSAESCARCGLIIPRSARHDDPAKAAKCIREGCKNDVEPGLCLKNNKPKRACLRACYEAWKEEKQADGAKASK